MKKTLAFLSVLGLSLAVPVLAQAADSAEYNSNGQITFEPNTDPTNPISPTDPDPENPNQLIQQTQMDQIREPTDRYRLILLQAFTLAHKKSPRKQRSIMRKPKNTWIQQMKIKKAPTSSK